MAADNEETRLYERAKAFDPVALEAIYDRYSGKIYNYIFHRVGDPDMAEDLTALTFTKMLEAIRSGRAWRTSFSGWLYRIAHNLVIDHYRRRGRVQQVSLDVGLPLHAEGEEPFQAAYRALQHEALRAAINKLTEDQAAVIIMRFLEGYSIAEVAKALGKTEGAVKALQFRAVERLRRLMEAER